MIAPPRTTARPAGYGKVTRYHARRLRRARTRRRLVGVLVVCAAVAGLAYVTWRRAAHRADDQAAGAAGYVTVDATGMWPAKGQAAYVVPGHKIRAGPGQHPAPIASLAKVMTAYVVLEHAPLAAGQDGPTLTVTAEDVADTGVRAIEDQSVVPVAEGEQLTEREALEALLIPSANNVAAMLARQVSGTEDAFVAEMNETAERFGMHDTVYTDPSGYDSDTRSTAVDQVILAQKATRDAVFASIVAMPQADLPVAGTVKNTDKLLGSAGFVGIKTGSHDAAGGCFMFQTRRTVDGQSTAITGVVLGQRGHDLIAVALAAASELADRIAPSD